MQCESVPQGRRSLVRWQVAHDGSPQRPVGGEIDPGVPKPRTKARSLPVASNRISGCDWDPARTAAGIMNWPDERDLFEQSPDAPDGLLVPELRHHDGELAGERDFGLAHAGASRQPRSPALHGRTLDWPGEAGPGGPHGPGPAQCVHAQIENIIALLPVKCAPSRLQLRRDCRSSKHSHSCVLRKDRDSPGPTTDHFVVPGNMNRP